MKACSSVRSFRKQTTNWIKIFVFIGCYSADSVSVDGNKALRARPRVNSNVSTDISDNHPREKRHGPRIAFGFSWPFIFGSCSKTAFSIQNPRRPLRYRFAFVWSAMTIAGRRRWVNAGPLTNTTENTRTLVPKRPERTRRQS